MPNRSKQHSAELGRCRGLTESIIRRSLRVSGLQHIFSWSTPVVRLRPQLTRASDLLSGPYRDLTRQPVLDGGTCCVEGSTMASGTVKWFNAQKGYGFIQPDDGSKDVFVHISAVERAGLSSLNENQKLSYELEGVSRGRPQRSISKLSSIVISGCRRFRRHSRPSGMISLAIPI